MREEYTNLIIQLINKAGMRPLGVLLGLIGGVLSVLYKVNGLSWRRALVVLISGGVLAGYGMPMLSENLHVGEGTGLFTVFIVGYIASDVFTYINKIVPSLLKAIGEKVKKKINKDDST